MKTYFLLIAISIFSINAIAQDKKTTETIKVWGNCGMCEEKIEKAAKKAGANEADWNSETKVLTVSYLASASSSLKIQQAIASAGYDTQDVKGDDKAYQKLHGCCKYDRKTEEAAAGLKEVAMEHKDCNKSCCK